MLITNTLIRILMLGALLVVKADDLTSSPSSSCHLVDLDFDQTPGVPTPEIRGLILPEDYYTTVGIARIHCNRSGRNTGVCRLFDTADPVGNWPSGACSCAPAHCQHSNRCGDTDLSPLDASLGNVLIVEERGPHQAGKFPPNDSRSGGTITLEFAEPTMVVSMGFVDTEEAVSVEVR